MKHTLTLLAVLLLAGLHAAEPASADTVPVAAQEASVPPGAWKLLFSSPPDITNTWGKIHFGATALQKLQACGNPGFEVIHTIPQSDGSCLVYGSAFNEDKNIKNFTNAFAQMAEVKTTWNLVRATTRDGVRFENVETVFTSAPANWQPHCAIAYNPNAKEFLMLRIVTDTNGMGYRAFFSPDGKNWKLHSNEPPFYDGDSMSLFWSPKAGRFVCICKTLQPFLKHLQDHGGRTSSLHNGDLRDRRVQIVRSSLDGRRWEPDVSMQDLWDRSGKKSHVPREFMTVSDANDPPDMEFYRCISFWYHDRSYAMVLNYAASPLAKLKHAPQLDTEWWFGRDGLHWERPYRGINALGDTFPEGYCVTHNPMNLNGMTLFRFGNKLLGMKQDRISYVGARANAEFSTTPFQMPKGDLLLNAAAPAPERAFAAQQAYIMVAVLDDKGEVVPGFEREKCVIQNADKIDLPLRWNGKSARELFGRNIRLRFSLRSASIFAVTSAPDRK
ncbi:MAG: hypothetical protein WCS99_10060 [Limisphaerales bacterium]